MTTPQGWLSDGLVTLRSVLRLPFHALVLAVATTAPGMSLSACAAPAGNRGAVVAGRAPARVAITGLIVNGVTARPLPGAIIDLDDRPRLSETGPDGRFRLDDIPVGVHLLGARAQHFRSRLQPVNIVVPDGNAEGARNDFIVLLFAPSGYFAGFPPLGSTPACRNEAECAPGRVCLMTNFKEGDAPVCSVPVHCRTESDCKLGQQCEPVTLMSGEEPHVCQGQPAPEVEQ
ncbi:MAG: carboxypeptidase-like regulatory domain-containing protein [Myxococcales bacterium]